GEGRFVQAPVQALLLHVLLDAQAPLFAAEAAVAPAAEGRADRELLVGVDPDRAGLHRAADAPGLLVVAGPDAGGQRVDAVVRLREEVVLVVERDRHQHRAEDLFLRRAIGVLQAVEDGGQVVVAALEGRTVRTTAAGDHARAFAPAQRHVRL